jgi:hypothetical protein
MNFPKGWKIFAAYAMVPKVKDILRKEQDPNLLEEDVYEFE